MKKTKCITFDKEAQNNLPEHIKEKMKADIKKAKAQSNCIWGKCKYPNSCRNECLHNIL